METPQVDTQARLTILNVIHDLESAIKSIKNYTELLRSTEA
jgi:hypothetical protein